jgi:hypothetical protein
MVLTSARSDDPLVGKWRNIVNQLEYFERMTPGNSVKEMESFFRHHAAHCDAGKLSRQAAEDRLVTTPTSSYRPRLDVHDSVRKRCLVFAAEKILELYDHLARRFNQDLAGQVSVYAQLAVTR